MKNLVLAGVCTAALVLGVNSAQAADLVSPAQVADPVAPIAPYDWRGAYIGVQGGLGIADSSGLPGHDTAGPQSSYSYNIEDILLGAYAGINFQSDSFVFGIEADVEYSGLEERVTTIPLPPPIGSTQDIITDIEWLGSVRGRLGYAMDNVLIYGTGGVAFGDVQMSHGLPGGGLIFHTYTETRVGWTVGGGLEYAITENLKGRGEYRYIDLGHDQDRLPAFSSLIDNDLKIHAVQVGLSWTLPIAR